ncbi:hypothetical protein C0Q70_20325 [Pomacea canaliculata]|uniref:SRCR domain-containing protein n=1 Tax=Pomacea canaliculata TaxID=400727 RepID=A0A2T7NFC5_POMCA|nr:hypothetical protein C0Q70_20325 [Pomacea canaliculata]
MRLFAEYQISLLGESYTGAVTVKYYGLEGHICSDEWDDADAQVACRELGFANGEMFNRLRTEEQQKPFWSSKFKCTGRERRLGDCNHAGWGQIKQCKSQHYAGVLCYDEQGLSFEVGDGSSAAGLLNISINGKWGVVCDPKWNDANARVLCRSMGYTDGRTWDDVGTQNASALWGTVLECKGDEASLKNCANIFWKTSEVCLPKPRLASAQCTHDGKLVPYTREYKTASQEPTTFQGVWKFLEMA